MTTHGDLDRVKELVASESGLAVLVTLREDGSAQATVVNAGVLAHPVSGEPVVGFAVRGERKKLVNLRERPRATVVFRSGWDWVTVEGDVEIVGPVDTLDGVEAAELPRLLREIYAAAVGGSADDWSGMDEQMRDEGHSAVLLRADRVYSNPVD